MNAEFLIPVAFFAMIYGIVYLLVRRKERQALIEKGLNASIFETQVRSLGSLKWGLLLVGIGVGIILGKILGAYTALEEEPAYFSMICLFGGLALIIYHIIAGKLENQPKQ
jgi:hypothetical protein